MKRMLFVFLAILLALTFAACGAPAAVPTPSPSDTEAPAAVAFSDPVLEELVRKAMNKPEGDISVAEAEAVTELNLGIEWQQQIPEETQIKDISGLENFKNLESLDLSFHAVSDISPLAGLSKLTSLTLGGNPVADLSPLSGLTQLSRLALFNCVADDYSPLENLENLREVMLDYSTITDLSELSGLTGLQRLTLTNTQLSDVSPLSALTSLRYLSLENCPITDFSPLIEIYPNLVECDFTMIASLAELGFAPLGDMSIVGYKTEAMSITINHEEWGAMDPEDRQNVIQLNLNDQSDPFFSIQYYPAAQRYTVTLNQNGQSIWQYIWNAQDNTHEFRNGTMDEMIAAINAMMPDNNGDALGAPISAFNDTIMESFDMTADELYALPMETKTPDTSSLIAMGFMENRENAEYLYEQHEPRYYNIGIHNPEWGNWDEGGDARFFTPLSDECRIVVIYDSGEKKFSVGLDDNNGGGAKFDYFVDTHEHVDTWCSDDTITVEQYFITAYDDSAIEDIYLHSVELMTNYVEETFGISLDELCKVPAGE
ncbi:MAG: leucine-rich repeat domain-containing protein [Clostridiales bacterium]|nr:leucine-rich repeat domain-containing protein [Clostridiales bacterium]